ncbi:MAG: sigma-70 family RNA polymerase sigma factor [Candidatus Hydrogenedentes bacterium]|nr:sigma-70 family RNA polymerase sigma factor [Candidatus Hydrogenedentota bacterium]
MFPSTQWSIILAAGDHLSAESSHALERMCADYWEPVYVYFRRHGHPIEDARDLTQAFFESLIQRGDLRQIDPAKGSFRAFLTAAIKNFSANAWDHRQAKIRGGNLIALSWDDAIENGLECSDSHSASLTSEQAFDRQWALSLLRQALASTREEYERLGKGSLFHSLQPMLPGSNISATYDDIARALGSEPGTIRVAVCRMRRRFRIHLRNVVASTLGPGEDIDEELRYMLQVLTAE